MMLLIVGGSGSGKSAYAEERTDALAEGRETYYLATMQAFDTEGRRKIERHRKLRAGRGFITIEQQADIQEALKKMRRGEKCVLLECMSNLVANEMFSGEKPKPQREVADKILKGTELLKEGTTHLTVVSNNVFEDGICYENETMEYIEAMGIVNQGLAALADSVIEVAAGIPVRVK